MSLQQKLAFTNAMPVGVPDLWNEIKSFFTSAISMVKNVRRCVNGLKKQIIHSGQNSTIYKIEGENTIAKSNNNSMVTVREAAIQYGVYLLYNSATPYPKLCKDALDNEVLLMMTGLDTSLHKLIGDTIVVNPEIAQDICLQALAQVSYALFKINSKLINGFKHRDLHSNNIMGSFEPGDGYVISDEEIGVAFVSVHRWYILDFGFACLQYDNGVELTSGQQTMFSDVPCNSTVNNDLNILLYSLSQWRDRMPALDNLSS